MKTVIVISAGMLLCAATARAGTDVIVSTASVASPGTGAVLVPAFACPAHPGSVSEKQRKCEFCGMHQEKKVKAPTYAP